MPISSWKLFYSFWNLGDYSQKSAFLTSRSCPRYGDGPTKTTVFLYFICDKCEDVRACKKFYLAMLKKI